MIDLPHAPRPARRTRPATRRRLLSRALIGIGIGMVPWLVVLATTLPQSIRVSHWAVTWVGLDALEAAGLACTGLLLRRADARCCLAAMATAVLLVVDAWLDVTTAAPGTGLAIAITMAAGAELPMAALCAVLAVKLLPR